MRETLEFIASTNFEGADDRAIAIIAQFLVYRAKDALAQPEQEPVVGTKTWFEDGKVVTQHLTAKDIYKEPEQEPVGRVCFSGDEVVWTDSPPESGTLLYTTPPAQPEQEPVATINDLSNSKMFTLEANGYSRKDKLYTTPPKRKPLTEEKIQDALEAEFLNSDAKRNWHDDVRVARAIEAAHGIKEKNT